MPRLSKAAMALCENIRNSHKITAESDSAHKSAASVVTATDNSRPNENVVGRKSRTRKLKDAAEAGNTSNGGLFSVEIVGGIGLPGFPLKDGEKLVVAKLVPLKVRA